MQAIYQMFFGWMPALMQVIVLGLLAFVVVLLIFKIVKIILDSLPFL